MTPEEMRALKESAATAMGEYQYEQRRAAEVEVARLRGLVGRMVTALRASRGHVAGDWYARVQAQETVARIDACLAEAEEEATRG